MRCLTCQCDITCTGIMKITPYSSDSPHSAAQPLLKPVAAQEPEPEAAPSRDIYSKPPSKPTPSATLTSRNEPSTRWTQEDILKPLHNSLWTFSIHAGGIFKINKEGISVASCTDPDVAQQICEALNRSHP